MITQKKMDEIFISTLEGIRQNCDLITSGNVAHYIPSIKWHCQEMIGFYKENPVNPWHSIDDGDLPPNNTYCLFPSSIDEFEVGYIQNGYVHFNDTEKPCPLKDMKYWMEIPKLPKKGCTE